MSLPKSVFLPESCRKGKKSQSYTKCWLNTLTFQAESISKETDIISFHQGAHDKRNEIHSVPENSIHGPGMGILDSGPGKTSEKSNLCKTWRRWRSESMQMFEGKAFQARGNSMCKGHEVGVGLICGKTSVVRTKRGRGSGRRWSQRGNKRGKII